MYMDYKNKYLKYKLKYINLKKKLYGGYPIKENICTIKIKDNGCGIEEKNIGKIFDPFFTTKNIGEGTGLGLSISYNIIKKHNGSIIAENNINSGACFTIEIPKTHTKLENVL